MIKAVIFDCWNTLFFTDLDPHPFVSFAKLLGEDFKNNYDYVKKFEKHLMLEKHTNINVPILSLLKELHIKPTKSLVNKLIKLMDVSRNEVGPYQDTFKVLNYIKSKYKLGLISNTDFLGYKTLQDKFKIEKIFDVSLPSFRFKISKPNSKIFNLMLEKLGVKSDEAVMIGDSFKDDYQASKKQGLNAILIDRKSRYPNVKERVTSLSGLLKLL